MRVIEVGVDQLEVLSGHGGSLGKPPRMLVALLKERGEKALPSIKVRPSSTPRKYQIIVGKEAWLAAQYAGMTVVPVEVLDVDDATAKDLARMEGGYGRSDNPIEQAERIQARYNEKRAQGRLDYTLQEAGALEDLSLTQTSHLLRLLALCPPVKKYVADGRIPSRIARLWANLKPHLQSQEAEHYLKHKPTSSKMETRLSKILKRSAPTPAGTIKKSPVSADGPPPEWIARFNRYGTDQLGYPVQLTYVKAPERKSHGQVALQYTTQEELEGILDKLRLVDGGRVKGHLLLTFATDAELDGIIAKLRIKVE